MRIAPILVLLLAAPGLAAEPDVAALCEEVRGLYEKASKELPFLATHDLIWNREITERMPGDAEERYTKQLVRLSFHHQSRFTAKVLLPCWSTRIRECGPSRSWGSLPSRTRSSCRTSRGWSTMRR